jgi:hypothetical protein
MGVHHNGSLFLVIHPNALAAAYANMYVQWNTKKFITLQNLEFGLYA